MTHEGVKNMMRIMTAAYPNYKPLDMKSTIAVWENLLAEYDDAKGAVALKAYIKSDTSGFAPSIGQIIDLMHYDPDQVGEMEAWGLVDKAIRNGVYGAEQEFSKLPDVVKEAVGSPGQLREWAMMDTQAVQSVGQSNFLRSYRVASERARKASRMPPEMARLFQRTKQFSELELKEEETTIDDGIPMPADVRQRLEEIIGGRIGGNG